MTSPSHSPSPSTSPYSNWPTIISLTSSKLCRSSPPRFITAFPSTLVDSFLSSRVLESASLVNATVVWTLPCLIGGTGGFPRILDKETETLFRSPDESISNDWLERGRTDWMAPFSRDRMNSIVAFDVFDWSTSLVIYFDAIPCPQTVLALNNANSYIQTI